MLKIVLNNLVIILSNLAMSKIKILSDNGNKKINQAFKGIKFSEGMNTIQVRKLSAIFSGRPATTKTECKQTKKTS